MTFPTPDLCPVVELATAAGTTVDTVAASVSTDGASRGVTEFSVDAEDPPDADATHLFSHGRTHRYRLVHEGEPTCPCEWLGSFECPVARYVAGGGSLTLVFHAADYEELRTVVGALRERFPDVDIRRFVRSPGGDQSTDTVLVDRSKLTDRQLEVVSTAYEMGYFERPRRANATEVAETLDVSPSTVTEHLAAAERKLLADVL